jgi:organic radical activating enzyme
MMSLYKVEKATPMAYKFVEWKIHNVCNHDCSFCGDRHKDGSDRWFSLEKYKEYTDKIVAACDGQPFWIQITGGEPTLFPGLIELLVYMKGKGAYISLISNGTRTLRWWEELKRANTIDHLFVTYHSEQTDNYQHIAEIINLFHDVPISTTCLITHSIESLSKSFAAHIYLSAHTGATILLKAMSVAYDIYSQYSPDQLMKLQKGSIRGTLPNKIASSVPAQFHINHMLKVTYFPATQKFIDPEAMMKMENNRFAGWECAIGQKNMRIDYDTVYRGVCEVGGYQKLSGAISFATDKIICTSEKCFCGTDMIATKTRPFPLPKIS